MRSELGSTAGRPDTPAMHRLALFLSLAWPLTAAGTTVADLRTAYPAIAFLGPEDTATVKAALSPADAPIVTSVMSIDETIAAVLDAGLARTPEPLRSAINRIAVVRSPRAVIVGGTRGVTGLTSGTLVIVGAFLCRSSPGSPPTPDCQPDLRLPVVDNYPTTIGTVVHEAAHCWEGLLTQILARASTSAWRPEVVQRAKNAINRNGLGSYATFVETFAQLQSSAARAGVASDYTGNVAASTGDDAASLAAAQAAGFARTYGREKAREDLASWVQALVSPGPSPLPSTCAALSGLGPRLPTPIQALVLAKLVFLRDLELLPQAAFEGCVGATTPLRAPGVGVTLDATDPAGARRFTQKVDAGWFAWGGRRWFRLRANQGEFEVSLLLADPLQNPRGLHALRPLADPKRPETTLLIASTKTEWTSAASSSSSLGGLAAITDFSLGAGGRIGRVEGFVLDLQMSRSEVYGRATRQPLTFFRYDGP